MRAIYKVPNGKLLKIFLEEENGSIKSIKITGDFFVYPEESIEMLEKRLIGSPRTADTLKKIIVDFVNEGNIRLFGLDADSLVQTIIQAS